MKTTSRLAFVVAAALSLGLAPLSGAMAQDKMEPKKDAMGGGAMSKDAMGGKDKMGDKKAMGNDAMGGKMETMGSKDGVKKDEMKK
jgi:pentapeptide MXKDX repeat protein